MQCFHANPWKSNQLKKGADHVIIPRKLPIAFQEMIRSQVKKAADARARWEDDTYDDLMSRIDKATPKSLDCPDITRYHQISHITRYHQIEKSFTVLLSESPASRPEQRARRCTPRPCDLRWSESRHFMWFVRFINENLDSVETRLEKN